MSPPLHEERHAAVSGRLHFANAGTGLREYFTSTRDEFRRSLNPRSQSNANVVAAELTLISKASRYYGFILPLIGLAIAVSFVGPLSWLRVMSWWLPMSALFAGATVLSRRHPQPEPGAPPQTVAKAAHEFVLTSAALTIAWCAMIPALWIPDNQFNHIVLALIVASSMASSSTVNAPHFISGRICLSIYGLSLTALPLLPGGSFNLLFLAMGLTFWLSMHLNMQSNYETTRQMLSLQDERTMLIENLQGAKEESDRARERAEQASQAKSQFLANMSHELRTPLNAILGFSEMLGVSSASADHEKSMEYARFVYDSGHHLLALINDILDLSKIEAGGLQLHETDIAIGTLISDCVRFMRARAEQGEVALTCKLSEPLPIVYADERSMRQILLNLLSNAIKFTPPGGEVTAFAYEQRDGSLVFGVRDTGVGIAKEDLDCVFEKFGQGRYDIAITNKGTGLGLPIVKGLAEAHDGEVRLVSNAGEGTCVSIWLPAMRCRDDSSFEETG